MNWILPDISHPALVLNSASPETTGRIGQRLAQLIRPELKTGLVVTLRGPLGAGKTALVRSLAVALGAAPNAVCSPSFVLINEYQGEGLVLYHADAYRLSGPEELENLGWQEMLAEPDRLILLEWPEKVAGLAGLDDPRTLHIHLAPTGEKSRQITIARG